MGNQWLVMGELKMINIYDGELADLLPWNFTNSNELLSISYAIKQETQRLLEYSKRVSIMDVDMLDVPVLDILATELRSPFYTADMPIGKKRTIIKNTLLWHLRAGTVGALDNLLTILYGDTISIAEWFEYDGKPYCFRIIFAIEDYACDVLELVKVIQEQKRCSAHLDSVIYKYTTRGNVGIKTYAKFGDSIKVKPKTIKNIDADTAKCRADAAIFQKNELKIKSRTVGNVKIETHAKHGTATIKNDSIYIKARGCVK